MKSFRQRSRRISNTVGGFAVLERLWNSILDLRCIGEDGEIGRFPLSVTSRGFQWHDNVPWLFRQKKQLSVQGSPSRGLFYKMRSRRNLRNNEMPSREGRGGTGRNSRLPFSQRTLCCRASRAQLDHVPTSDSLRVQFWRNRSYSTGPNAMVVILQNTG